MPRTGGKVCPEILSCLGTQFFLCITEDKGKTVVNLEILNQKANVEYDMKQKPNFSPESMCPQPELSGQKKKVRDTYLHISYQR